MYVPVTSRTYCNAEAEKMAAVIGKWTWIEPDRTVTPIDAGDCLVEFE